MVERLTSTVAVVSIADTSADRARIEDACFTPAELDELRGRAVQSLAGWLALKRALVELAVRLGRPAPAERDFVLSRAPSGAPRLVPGHPLADAGDPLVSISHTRAWAYALAVAKAADEA
jgi:phosphopantetheinyl transferase (holo-ACP synthase)